MLRYTPHLIYTSTTICRCAIQRCIRRYMHIIYIHWHPPYSSDVPPIVRTPTQSLIHRHIHVGTWHPHVSIHTYTHNIYIHPPYHCHTIYHTTWLCTHIIAAFTHNYGYMLRHAYVCSTSAWFLWINIQEHMKSLQLATI